MSPADDDELSGPERAEELTRDAWKRAMTPAELWAMPVHQLLFAWYKQPDEVPRELLEIVAEQNEGKLKPFIPSWLLSQYRR